MKKIFMFAVIAISGLFLTTNVYAKTSDPVCTNGNITSMNSSNEACILTSELTIDATSVEKTINGIIKVQSGGKLTITGNSKVTLNHSIIVYGGGELIIDASNVEATHGIASVFGKMIVGPNANIIDNTSNNWSIYTESGADITLKGNITATNANILSVNNNTNITVDGSKLNAGNDKSIFDFINSTTASNVSIKDGEFNGTTFSVLSGDSISESSNIEIESGKFSETDTIKPEYIASGAKLNEDGTVTKVEEKQPENNPQQPSRDDPSNDENTTNTTIINKIIDKTKLDDVPKTGVVYTLINYLA